MIDPKLVTYRGPAIDDGELLEKLPSELRELLVNVNGFILFGGGFHLRGACRSPEWHSLREIWLGSSSLCDRYPDVQRDDIPFGQESTGDQFLLRDESVHRLLGETGEVKDQALGLSAFLEALQRDPVEVLLMHPFVQFRDEGGTLVPGELLSVVPPFCMERPAQGYSFRAVPADDRLSFLAHLSAQLASVPNGAFVKFEVREGKDD